MFEYLHSVNKLPFELKLFFFLPKMCTIFLALNISVEKCFCYKKFVMHLIGSCKTQSNCLVMNENIQHIMKDVIGEY